MTSPTPTEHLAPGPRAELRRQLLTARANWVNSPSALNAEAALGEKLLGVLRQLEPECLGLYWPVQGEFNPRAAALKAQAEWPCQLALPWAHRAPRQMHYRAWDAREPDGVDECGIPSPSVLQPCEPDVVVVPCVGFTPEGFRLGYGGGYFDRYLAAHPEVTAIGVSWAMGKIDLQTFNPQAHDWPLMCVLTETP